jgi:hypothetical protein
MAVVANLTSKAIQLHYRGLSIDGYGPRCAASSAACVCCLLVLCYVLRSCMSFMLI